MSVDPDLVLSAYLDGEPVEPAAVIAALDTEEGRRVLVDFVRLRLATADDVSPRPEFYARMRGVVPTLPGQRRSVAWPAAAALAASVAIGFWMGSAFTNRNVTSLSTVSPGGPPKVVRVIEFQQGVDWHQSPSGQEVVR